MATMTMGQLAYPSLMEPGRKRDVPLVLGLPLHQAARDIARLKCIINHVFRSFVLD